MPKITAALEARIEQTILSSGEKWEFWYEELKVANIGK